MSFMKVIIPICCCLLMTVWVVLFLPGEQFDELVFKYSIYVIPYVLSMLGCYLIIVISASRHAVANSALTANARLRWVFLNFTGFWAIIYWFRYMRGSK